MHQVAVRLKNQLGRLRTNQRRVQRDLEKDVPNIEEKPLQFCLVCRLNYRTDKDEHQISEAHINMQKFLLPKCKFCHITFNSPKDYEIHRATLEHIKV